MTLVCDTAFIEPLSATQNAIYTETLFKVFCFTYKKCMGIIKRNVFQGVQQSGTHCLIG